MTHTVWIPPVHRDLTQGVEQANVEGATLGEVVKRLDALYPGLADRLTVDGDLRSGIAVAINGEFTTRGLRQRLTVSSEIHFVPAISGG